VIQFDPAKDRSDIDAQLGLDRETSVSFWTRVSWIVEDINQSTVALAKFAEGRNRQQIIAYIEGLSRCLATLEQRLAEGDANTNAVRRSQLGSRVGELLSIQAFEELIHESPGHSVSSRFPPARMSSRDDGLYRAWEDEVTQRRVNIARIYAPRLLGRLAGDLNRPLLRLLEVEQENEGGAPGKRHRNLVIDELAPVYRWVYGEDPVTTPGGKFALLCSLVLEEIGIDIEGLDSAIARRLKKLKAI
jgi:hypothetical protein